MKVGDHRAGVGAQLGLESIGIGFEREKISVRAENFIFVHGAFAHFREKKFPDARRTAWTHGMNAAVPVIHIAHDTDAAGRGRPDGEVRSGHSRDRLEVRAKLFVSVEVAAFTEEMEIKIGEKERECVGIEDFEGFASVSATLNFVTAGFGSSRLIRRPHGFEEAFRARFYRIGNLCRRVGRILEHDAGFSGPRNKKSDGPSGGNWMGAENAKRIRILSGEKRIDACVKIREGLPVRQRGRCGERLGVFWRQVWILRQRAEVRQA